MNIKTKTIERCRRIGLAVLAGGCSLTVALAGFGTSQNAFAYTAIDPDIAEWTSSENLCLGTDGNGNVTFNKDVLNQIARSGGWTDINALLYDIQSGATYDAAKFKTNPDTGAKLQNGIQIQLGTVDGTDGTTQSLYWEPVYLTKAKDGSVSLDLFLSAFPTNFEYVEDLYCYYSTWYDLYYGDQTDYPCDMYSTSLIRSFMNGTPFSIGFSFGEPENATLNDTNIDPTVIIAPNGFAIPSEEFRRILSELAALANGETDETENSEAINFSEYGIDLRQYCNGDTISADEVIQAMVNNVHLCSDEMGKEFQSNVWKSFLEQLGYNNDNGSCNYLLTPSQIDYQETESILDNAGLTSQAIYSGFADRNTLYSSNNDAYGEITGSFLTYNDYSNDYQTKPNYSDWKNDYLWIPSLTETGCKDRKADQYYAGLWNLNRSELSFDIPGKSHGFTLRSSSAANECIHYDMIAEDDNSYWITNMYDNWAVRPALHLNLTAAAASAVDSPTGTHTGVTYDANDPATNALAVVAGTVTPTTGDTTATQPDTGDTTTQPDTGDTTTQPDTNDTSDNPTDTSGQGNKTSDDKQTGDNSSDNGTEGTTSSPTATDPANTGGSSGDNSSGDNSSSDNSSGDNSSGDNSGGSTDNSGGTTDVGTPTNSGNGGITSDNSGNTTDNSGNTTDNSGNNSDNTGITSDSNTNNSGNNPNNNAGNSNNSQSSTESSGDTANVSGGNTSTGSTNEKPTLTTEEIIFLALLILCFIVCMLALVRVFKLRKRK